MIAGNVQPIGPCQANYCTNVATTRLTGSGLARWGVGWRTRPPKKGPWAASTMAPLIPEPLISIPRMGWATMAGPSRRHAMLPLCRSISTAYREYDYDHSEGAGIAQGSICQASVMLCDQYTALAQLPCC